MLRHGPQFLFFLQVLATEPFVSGTLLESASTPLVETLKDTLSGSPAFVSRLLNKFLSLCLLDGIVW